MPFILFIVYFFNIYLLNNHRRFVHWTKLHDEVAAGPFCLIVNSPWPLVYSVCLFFILSTVVSLICWKSSNICVNSSTLSSCSYATTVSIFTLIIMTTILAMHFWFRDIIREFYKKYEILLMCLFLVFFIFICSEALLFVSFFWASFHSLSSPSLGVFPGEGLHQPDPCELTFTNTLLLSNAAVSMGGAFLSMELSSSFYCIFALISFILALTFISLQVKEFRVLSSHINDSVYSSIFFFITGLHFFHLLVGLFILGIFFWAAPLGYSLSRYVSLRISDVHLFYNLQLFYWHFIEMLWLFIYLVLYLY
jgi:heme/copper-type cytochrome/quinol oxidase subunit 3